jgi:hypothetical protein
MKEMLMDILLGSLLAFVLVVALVFFTPANAQHWYMPEPPEEPVQVTSTDGNYGLMALASSGLVFDCCRPGALQWSVAGAFVEGGNQSLSGGLATNFGNVLINVRFVTTLDSVNDADDFTVIVGGSGTF